MTTVLSKDVLESGWTGQEIWIWERKEQKSDGRGDWCTVMERHTGLRAERGP